MANNNNSLYHSYSEIMETMTTEIVEEVVNKLVGKIRPVGETNTDNDRFENLVMMCELVNSLIREIDNVAYLNADSQLYSLKKAGTYAKEFLTNTLGIKE